MATRHNSRKSARRRHSRENLQFSRPSSRSLLGRRLRYEPLEERNLLAVVTVTTLADTVDFNDGLTSLREAIFATNLVGGADTIDFASILTASGPATILLTQGELKISDDLAITGPGADLLTIDASGDDPTPELNNGDGSRIFGIDDANYISFLDVSLSGLTLTGGDVAGQGGAIHTLENLSLHNTWLVHNASSRDGGALYAHLWDRGEGPDPGPAHITVTESVISHNQGGTGGGVAVEFHSDGLVNIESTIITDNQARSVGGGGWIKVDRGALQISDSQIAGNSAGSGGGLSIHLLYQTQLVMDATSIENNTARSRVGGGIDLSVEGASALLTNSTISGNSGSSGGGGAFVRGFSGSVEFDQVTISGNTTARSGGGIAFSQIGSTTFAVRHSTIVGNKSQAVPSPFAYGGGGISFSGNLPLELDHTIVAQNTALGDVGPDIWAPQSSVDASFSLIGNNSMTNLMETLPNVPDASGNLIGGPIHGVIDPMLGPLADNGGPTLTHALLPGSPAINAGDLNLVAGKDGVPLFDQRGEPFSRVVNGRIDIGAFEYQSPSDLNLLVDTLVDESDGDYSRGDLSLREAIMLANKWLGSDTIRFDQDLAGGTILLTLGEIKITNTVSIVGLGAELLTIDASGNDPTSELNNGDGSRIFNLERANARTTFNISISGLTLTGGDVGGNGGAILGREHLILNEMMIVDNATREYGGGVFFVDESSVMQNTLEIRNSTISGNTSQPAGGGVAARMMGGTLTFADNVITGNEATGLASRGGGIYVNLRNTQATIVGNTVGENSAGFGGGIWASNVIGQMLIDDSRIVGNSATSPKGEGGGIVFKGDNGIATLRNSTIENNLATGISGRGGGLYSGGEQVVIQGCTITGNQAGGVGGGIYNRAALKLSDTTVAGNSAINIKAIGGGIYHTGPRNIEIVASTISGNAATLNGGGVFIITNAAVTSTIDGSTVSGNSATYDGGGIFVQNGRLQLNDSTIAENTAGRDGGGVFVVLGAATITGSTINNNVAGAHGGGVASKSSTTSLVNSTLSRNRATLNGGGLWSSHEAVLSHSTIAFNRADQFGGGVFVNDGSLAINHTIVAHNVALFGRDLSGLLGASINASYSLIGSSQGSGLTPAPVGSPDANGNIIGGASSNFIDARLGELADNGGPTKTHALLFESPAIDAGNPAAIAGEDGVPEHDQRGEPFDGIVGGRIDIGAFEFRQGPLLEDYNGDGGVNAADYVMWRKLQGSPAGTGGGVEASQNGIVVSNDVAVTDVGFQEIEAGVRASATAQAEPSDVKRVIRSFAAIDLVSTSGAQSGEVKTTPRDESQSTGRHQLRFDLLADAQSVRQQMQTPLDRSERTRWDVEPNGSELSLELQLGAVDAVFECFHGAPVGNRS